MHVHIHGNCQSTPLRKILEECKPEWRVTNREVHSIDLSTEIPDYEEEIKSANVIMAQPIANNYRGEPRLSSTWIRENKRPDAKLVTFVPMYFRGYCPETGYLTGLQNFRSPYFDYNIVEAYLCGSPAEDIASQMTRDDFYSRKFVRRHVTSSIDEMRRRESDARADLVISDLVADGYRNNLQFFTFNHPARVLLVNVVRRALVLLKEHTAVSDLGPEYRMDDTLFSPYRCTKEALRLAPTEHDGRIRAAAIDFDRLEYTKRSFAYFEHSIGREKLTSVANATPTFMKFRAMKASLS